MSPLRADRPAMLPCVDCGHHRPRQPLLARHRLGDRLGGYVVVLVVTSVADADIAGSIWEWLGAGWQRWVVFGAGISMLPTFGPMLLSNGVTRARLSASAALTMVLVAIGGALVVVAGYGIEDVAFARNDWHHVLDDESAVGGVTFLASTALEMTLTLAAYFASGWLIGISFYRFGRDGGVPLVLPCLVPAVAAELLLHNPARNVIFGFADNVFDDIGQPHAAIGVPVTIVVLAVACVVATRFTRGVALEG